MKDTSTCLVSCDGLYADISDNSLEQTVMKGVTKKHFCHIQHINSGFRALTEGLSVKDNGEYLDHLQQMLSTYSNEAEQNGHMSLMEQYNSYKESYVKHQRFDPEEQALSTYFSENVNVSH